MGFYARSPALSSKRLRTSVLGRACVLCHQSRVQLRPEVGLPRCTRLEVDPGILWLRKALVWPQRDNRARESSCFRGRSVRGTKTATTALYAGFMSLSSTTLSNLVVLVSARAQGPTFLSALTCVLQRSSFACLRDQGARASWASRQLGTSKKGMTYKSRWAQTREEFGDVHLRRGK
ncbi:hypothetical protein BD309DRAFT_38723 [Dichomitus squalens]|nr:hypothetical protein BD309DRAFT_38723 [Dichomitus squalens]